MPQLKEQLYSRCRKFIAERIAEIQEKVDDAQDAANNEDKSSAGDKYETGREMFQQEINLNLALLDELYKQKQTLDLIQTTGNPEFAIPGSIVHTPDRHYYIAISAGKLQVNGDTYYAVSASSPIGQLLMGKKPGSTFTLNGKEIRVDGVE